MKITAGKRGDAAREAKDKAENQFYWDSYNRSRMLPQVKEEYQSRTESTKEDIRRQIDRLISDGYAKQIFEDDVDIDVQVGYGNTTYSKRDKARDKNFRDSENPEQIRVTIGNKWHRDAPFGWEWRASFDYKWGKSYNEGTYELKKDISSYSFNSSNPEDIDYFAACGEIFKALGKANWNKILTTDPYVGMEDMLINLPEKPDRRALEQGGRYDSAIQSADIEDAIEEWKTNGKWLYVGRPSKYHENNTNWDTTYDNLEDGPGYYRYVGETDQYYKVEYMSRGEGRKRMKEGEPAVKDTWQYKSKVKKDAFKNSVYWPITWFGHA